MAYSLFATHLLSHMINTRFIISQLHSIKKCYFVFLVNSAPSSTRLAMELMPDGTINDRLCTYDEYLEGDADARKRTVYTMVDEDN